MHVGGSSVYVYVFVGVRRCMRIWKSQWQPYQNEGPRGAHGKKKGKNDRPTKARI